MNWYSMYLSDLLERERERERERVAGRNNKITKKPEDPGDDAERK